MEPQAIREAVHHQPFQPFTLRLVDGVEITIRHPDFISVAPNGRRIIVWNEDSSMSIIEPLLITALELPATQQNKPNQSNGNQT